MHFKVRPSTKFSKVFDAYCQRKALQPNAVRFLMDGERLRPDQTPEEMDTVSYTHLTLPTIRSV